MSFVVTWPSQVLANHPPEEFRSEAAALVRARELVATGNPHACVYEIEDENGDAA